MKHVKTLTVVAILTMGLWGKANAQIENVVINEIMPANIDLLVDPSWNYGGFIEFYNPTETNIALYGYYLSDDPDNLTKWKIMDNKSSAVMRSKGFATIWFDHNSGFCGCAYIVYVYNTLKADFFKCFTNYFTDFFILA